MDADNKIESVLGDVTVIGAGIVGLTSALYLQKAGYKVTVLDKEGIAAGASEGNAGHFATEQVFPLANPSLLLKLPSMLIDPLGPFRIMPKYFPRVFPWFMLFLWNMLPARRDHNSKAIKALNELSIAELKELVTFCDCPELLVLKGSLLVFEGNSITEVEQEWRMYNEAGVKVELLTGEEVRQLEPNLSQNISHGLFFTQVGHTPNPYLLCLAVANKFKALGGNIKVAQVKSIEAKASVTSGIVYADTISLMLEGEEKLSCSKLLLTAGAWSKPFAKQLGHSVPLETERGYHLMMPHHSELSRPVASYNRKFIITPMTHGTRFAGMVEFGGLKAPMSPERAESLFSHGQALLPTVFANTSAKDGKSWMGFRPSLPDSLPIIGKTNVDNVYVSFGHQHLGLTWSGISAKLIAQIILDQNTSLDIRPYNIDRFR